MEKSKIKNILSKLSNLFSDDLEAMEAIEVLKNKTSERKTESKSQKGEFPIPNEVKKNDSSLVLFSDGGCRGNPGPGAWGIMAQKGSGEIIFENSGFNPQTTNNQMELMAAIQSLKLIFQYCRQKSIDPKSPSLQIYLFSDSKYVVDGIMKWVSGWKKRGWKKADNKVPENLEMWKQIDELQLRFSNLTVRWVRGHSGHPQNEYCDLLVNMAIDDALS